jgi:hypothetical protein
LSGEHVEHIVEEDGFATRYRDMGSHRLVARAATASEIRDAFLEQLTWLAAGHERGRRAGQVREGPSWCDTMTDDEVVVRYLREPRRE